jgi:hypothetical protein
MSKFYVLFVNNYFLLNVSLIYHNVGKLNDAKAADGTEGGAVETSNQGKTGAISRDDFQM